MHADRPPFDTTRLWRALAACGLAVAGVPAWAQAVAPAAAASSPEAAPARRDAGPQTIVISATRRVERLQEVPLAVSAIGGGDLAEAGVKDLNNLQFVVPGLQVGDTPSDKGFRVRGVGSLTGTYVTGQELPVGVVIDGVVQGLGAGISNLADVERVEVLKGPQGTQFGKNSAAGMVSVTTVKPRLRRFEGSVGASFGSGGEYETRAGLNVPLGETVAARVTVFAKGFDDFVDNLSTGTRVGGEKQSGGRLRLLAQPTKDLELVLTADTSKQDINSGSQLWTMNASSATQAGITYGIGNFATRELLPGKHTYDRSGLSLEVNWQVAGYTLTSVTAARKLTEVDYGGFGQGYGAVPFPPFTIPGTTWWNQFDYDKKQTTQELRVTSPRGEFMEYVAGLLYYRQPSHSHSTGGVVRTAGGWIFNAQNGLTLNDSTTTSRAIFADGKLRFGPAVSLLGGLRYTEDDVDTAFGNRSFDGGRLGAAWAYTPPTPIAAGSRSASASKATGKLGAEWKVAHGQLLFGTVSTGYLGPIVNWGWSTGASDVLKPQTNTNITLGLKSESADRKVTFNANVFHDDFKNFQTGYFQPAPAVQFRAENAAEMKVRGVEAEFTARFDNGLALNAALAYVRSTFGDFCSGGSAAAAASGLVPRCTTALGFAGGNNIGLTPPGAPRLTSNIGVSYGTTLPGDYFLKTTLSHYERSKSRNTPSDPATELAGYGITNFNITLTPPSDRWLAGLYVRNLFDKPFAAAVMSSSSFAPANSYVNWVTREAKRTIGANVEYRF